MPAVALRADDILAAMSLRSSPSRPLPGSSTIGPSRHDRQRRPARYPLPGGPAGRSHGSRPPKLAPSPLLGASSGQLS